MPRPLERISVPCAIAADTRAAWMSRQLTVVCQTMNSFQPLLTTTVTLAEKRVRERAMVTGIPATMTATRTATRTATMAAKSHQNPPLRRKSRSRAAADNESHSDQPCSKVRRFSLDCTCIVVLCTHHRCMPSRLVALPTRSQWRGSKPSSSPSPSPFLFLSLYPCPPFDLAHRIHLVRSPARPTRSRLCSSFDGSGALPSVLLPSCRLPPLPRSLSLSLSLSLLISLNLFLSVRASCSASLSACTVGGI